MYYAVQYQYVLLQFLRLMVLILNLNGEEI